MSNAQELVSLFDGADSLAVVSHDNPDPDSLASALALVTIADRSGVDDADILYGGEISHQQNRVFINLFDIEMMAVSDVDLAAYELVAFVDHSIPGKNTQVQAGTTPDIVIDHHPVNEPVSATYVDRREGYGATTSIFVDYIRELDIDPRPKLASALLFALHRERIDYVRRPTIKEYEAAGFLYPHVEQGFLDQMYGAAFTPATLDAIGEAIRDRKIRGSTLITCVGRTPERDSLPQAADYLLTLEGINTVLVFGLVEDTVHMSARSIDPRVDMGEILTQAFGDVGSTGGHQDMAGAQIPLGLFADHADDDADIIPFVSKRIESRFFEAMRLKEESSPD